MTNTVVDKRKYRITKIQHPVYPKCFRIQAVNDIIDIGVAANEYGGYVENEFNLNQTDTSWIGGDCCVMGSARIFGDKVRISGCLVIDGIGSIRDVHNNNTLIRRTSKKV